MAGVLKMLVQPRAGVVKAGADNTLYPGNLTRSERAMLECMDIQY